ncbi:MAG: hydantoinase/oxoprolinase family protein, partial [Planctomycetia bacterium]
MTSGAIVPAAKGDPGADVLAFDIGGANIKVADGRGWAHSEPFELWLRRPELPQTLRRLLRGRPRRVVVTMTGEIADCYGSRREGVADIVAAVEEAVGPGVSVGVYLVDGSIVSPEEAVRRPLDAAASNWHAVARLAAAAIGPGPGLLIDVGSTTTDVVPLCDGAVTATARDDVGRMAAGELVYTGVERTPVAAVVRALPWRGRMRPVASERYADSRDVWLLLGGLPENEADRGTADGGPATRAAARRRLARMLLADPEDVTEEEAVGPGVSVGVYLVDGSIVSPEEA